MHLGALKRASEAALLGLAVLFLITLSLDWHRTSVRVLLAEGDAEAASSGWSGWGLVAGLCALAIVGLELDRQFRGRSHEGQTLVDLGLAVGAAIATVAAVFTGDASVSAGASGVEVGTTLWPAWVGLVLAALMVVAALVPTLPEANAEATRATPNLS
jgi:hypothetical protein